MSTTSYKKPFLVVFLIVATELIGFGLIVPILPQLSLKFNASAFMLGLLLAAYSLAQFIAAPLLGSLSDKYGRKPILIISKIGTVLAYTLMALTNSYTGFLVARLLDGFTGGNISVARAYLADITEPEDRPKGMAIIGVSFGLGFLLGPAIGGFVYNETLAHASAACIAGGLSLVATILTVLLLEESKTKEPAKTALQGLRTGLSMVKRPAVAVLLIAQFVYMTAFSGFEVTLSVFTERLFSFTAQDNSWLFVYVGFVAFLVQGSLARRAPKRLKPATLLGLLVVGLCYFAFGSLNSVDALYWFLGLMAIGISLVNVYLPSMLALFTTDDNRGALMGVYEGIGSLSRIVGPLLIYMGFMADISKGYLLFSGGIAIIGLLMLLSINMPNDESKNPT